MTDLNEMNPNPNCDVYFRFLRLTYQSVLTGYSYNNMWLKIHIQNIFLLCLG